MVDFPAKSAGKAYENSELRASYAPSHRIQVLRHQIDYTLLGGMTICGPPEGRTLIPSIFCEKLHKKGFRAILSRYKFLYVL